MSTGFLTRRRLDREQLVPHTRRLRLRLRQYKAVTADNPSPLNAQELDTQQLQSAQDIRLLRRARRWGVSVLPEDFAACSRIFHPVLNPAGRQRLAEAVAGARRARLFAGAMILVGVASLIVVSLQ